MIKVTSVDEFLSTCSFDLYVSVTECSRKTWNLTRTFKWYISIGFVSMLMLAFSSKDSQSCLGHFNSKDQTERMSMFSHRESKENKETQELGWTEPHEFSLRLNLKKWKRTMSRCLIGETQNQAGLWSARIAPQLLMTPTVPFSPKARINIKPWSHLLTWSSILPQVFTHTHRRECTQTSSRAGWWWKRGRLSSGHGTNMVHTGAAPTEPLIIQYIEQCHRCLHNEPSLSLWAWVVFCH